MPLHLQALACTSAAASAATGPDGNNAAMTLAHMRDKHLDVTTGRGDFKFPELYINTGVTAHVTPPPFWCSEGVPPKVGLFNIPTQRWAAQPEPGRVVSGVGRMVGLRGYMRSGADGVLRGVSEEPRPPSRLVVDIIQHIAERSLEQSLST